MGVAIGLDVGVVEYVDRGFGPVNAWHPLVSACLQLGPCHTRRSKVGTLLSHKSPSVIHLGIKPAFVPR